MTAHDPLPGNLDDGAPLFTSGHSRGGCGGLGAMRLAVPSTASPRARPPGARYARIRVRTRPAGSPADSPRQIRPGRFAPADSPRQIRNVPGWSVAMSTGFYHNCPQALPAVVHRLCRPWSCEWSTQLLYRLQHSLCALAYIVGAGEA
jgi:hypothetical protein